MLFLSSLPAVGVALRKESVDRNLVGGVNRAIDIVALRKESVDRNSVAFVFGFGAKLSLSARRAWIEIPGRSGSRRGRDRRSPQGERG